MLYSETTDISDRQTVAELVTTYQTAEATILRCFAEVHAATTTLSSALFTDAEGARLVIRTGTSRRPSDVDFGEPTQVIRNLRADAWGAIIERAEVRKVMSIAAWEGLQKKLRDEDPLPITVENVSGFIDQLRADVPDMLTAAVHEVFDFLRPHYDRFKTNSQFEIGKKVVLEYAIDPDLGHCRVHTWQVQHHWDQKLIALENVFAMLDRKLTPPSGYYSNLACAIRECRETCHGATDLFEFRGHKKGTLHLTFRRPDLVARLNAVAGGNRLRSAA